MAPTVDVGADSVTSWSASVAVLPYLDKPVHSGNRDQARPYYVAGKLLSVGNRLYMGVNAY